MDLFSDHGAHLEHLVPILFLLIPLVAIIGGLIVKVKRAKLQHETLRRFVERGQPIPPALLQGGESWPTLGPGIAARAPLRAGAVNMGVGLGLMVMFYTMGGGWLWSIGCIPLFIGVAYLIVWAIERKSHPNG